MSEMKHASVCYPPPFPLEGRLPFYAKLAEVNDAQA